jgi:ribonucleotide reductase beta subunit family protein with ferritin-like domain
MTYKEIETSLTENNFKLEFGFSPLKGMRFSNGNQFAFVFVVKENGSLKHKVEYVDIIGEA